MGTPLKPWQTHGSGTVVQPLPSRPASMQGSTNSRGTGASSSYPSASDVSGSRQAPTAFRAGEVLDESDGRGGSLATPHSTQFSAANQRTHLLSASGAGVGMGSISSPWPSHGFSSLPFAPAGYGGGFPSAGFGGNPYGMGMGMAEWPGASPHVAMLQHVYAAVGSVGAITELLGMNAEALQRVVLGGIGLLEKLGQHAGEVAGVLRLKLPVDEEGRPLVSDEQARHQRRMQLLRLILGAVVCLAGIALVRKLFRTGRQGLEGQSQRPARPHVLWALASFAVGWFASTKLVKR